MLDIYTVSFFGHRRIYDIFNLESLIEKYIHDILSTKEYVEFLVGRDGDFDQIVTSCIKRVKRKFVDCNSSIIWIMPYIKSDYKKNQNYYEKYYDEIIIFEESQSAYPKAAFNIRNQIMIDRSDLIFFYVEHTYGGAYKSMQYAKKQHKKIINLYDKLK